MSESPGEVPKTLVLNVNDHEGVRYMTSRMLDRAGYDVAEASTGEEALELVQRLKPRLVVLDIKLPDGSGLDVCRRIKLDPQSSSVKVLHTSAVFVAPEAKVQSLNSGADSYLSHPFEQEELVATARSLLRLADAEQRLRDTAAELQDANRRTHEFLAMLAHELRNPLSAIATCLPVLERQPARDAMERTSWTVIRRQTQNLRRLVDDLLDTARVTQGKIEPKWETVDLRSLLERVAASARQAFMQGRDQALTLDLPESKICVRGDSLRLEQVFANLLDNASKYTDDGGRIDVRLECAASEPGRAVVSIRDTGIGIAPEALASVFNLFSQADVPLCRSRGGLGIGLTLARTLIELHGGGVSVDSEGVGKGCEVRVWLPVLAGMALCESEFEASRPVASSGVVPYRILVVEDNLDARNMLRHLLEMWGHEVEVAADGLTGLDAVRGYRPQIALVDIGLPVIDGYELARRLRGSDERAELLLVALTGYGAPEQRARALDAGFDLHLVKPVEPEQLAELIAARSQVGQHQSGSAIAQAQRQ